MRTFSPRQQALILAAVFFATAIVVTRTAAQTAWRQLDGPTGGIVTELVAAPDGSIFAITPTSLLRSTDRGGSWQHADRGLPRYIALWLLPTRTGTLLAAAQATEGSHLYRSTDMGATWSESTVGLPETYTFSIAPLALDVNGDVFVAHTKFIFHSTDDGATWLSTGATSAGRDLQALDGDLYVIGSRGITHLDGDDAMRERVIPVPQGLLAYWMMVGPGARITAHLQAGQTFGYYRTDDSGRTWTKLDLPEAWLGLRRDRSGGLLGVGGWLHRSTDGGDTWSTIAPIDTVAGTLDAVEASDGTLVAAHTEGMVRSTDAGSTWHDANRGFAERKFVLVSAHRDAIYALELGRLMVSEDDGRTWRRCDPFETRDSLQYLLGITPDGAVFIRTHTRLLRSTDVGRTWSTIAHPGRTVPYVLAANAELIATLTGYGDIHLSSDRGSTWKTIPGPAEFGDRIMSIGIGQGGAILVGESWQTMRTTDEGATWTKTALMALVSTYTLAADSNLYTVSDQGVHWSPNGVSRWTQISPRPFERRMQAFATDGRRALVSFQDTLFLSDDRGASWQGATDGFERRWAGSLAASGDGRFYATAYDGGIFTLGERASVEPQRFRLRASRLAAASIAPQPASTRAALTLELRAPSQVRVDLVDALGRVRETLVDAGLEPGAQTIALDVRALPAGVHHLRTTHDDGIVVTPLVVIH